MSSLFLCDKVRQLRYHLILFGLRFDNLSKEQQTNAGRRIALNLVKWIRRFVTPKNSALYFDRSCEKMSIIYWNMKCDYWLFSRIQWSTITHRRVVYWCKNIIPPNSWAPMQRAAKSIVLQKQTSASQRRKIRNWFRLSQKCRQNVDHTFPWTFSMHINWI